MQNNKFTYAQVKAIKDQIAQATSNDEKVALFEQLVPMLKEPAMKRVDMTYEQRSAKRAQRKANREAGINTRTGKPWTEEQRAKQAARWTPERRAEQSAKAVGRKQSPEALANIRQAAQARKDKQIAMENRLAELEAQLAEKNSNKRK